MKVVSEEILVNRITDRISETVSRGRADLNHVLNGLHHPPGAGKFIIHPEHGKKRGRGNGVRPIRDLFVAALSQVEGWKSESEVLGLPGAKPGDIDATLDHGGLRFCVEWETGNVSSVHRSLNKMSLCLLNRLIVGGTVIVPTRIMARYLTDRVANADELVPYFGVWRAIPINEGFLGVLIVEHDETSPDVPRFRKGTDGRAIY